ncbi:glycosyltransferase [Acetobacterium bakii]|uniref:glycosyltransferase n=1 Tax=Acetobacterium bakii TaxID=52689 RepID=UPI00067F97BC|nr:glycosyltransferase [Acetobacterium bakii]
MYYLFNGLCILISIIFMWRTPFLPKKDALPEYKTISVIIPARNEAQNLPLLLKALKKQSILPLEIICVDDESEDQTGQIAESFGITIKSIISKPDDWTGKTYACQQGAILAKGELLLFLDADVRPSPDAIKILLQRYINKKDVISVQPFHLAEKVYEKLALFFNLIAVYSLGLGVPFKNQVNGSFGPVTLINRREFFKIGGYESVRHSVLEDYDFSVVLKREGYRLKRFMGGNLIGFRMYPGGLKDLFGGFSKNMASGALKSPLWLILVLVLMLGAYTESVILLTQGLMTQNISLIWPGSLFYALTVMILFWRGRCVGSFGFLTALFYPIPLLFFYLVFIYSLFSKLVLKRTYWKGRKIKL